jgi:hypothetical protein
MEAFRPGNGDSGLHRGQNGLQEREGGQPETHVIISFQRFLASWPLFLIENIIRKKRILRIGQPGSQIGSSAYREAKRPEIPKTRAIETFSAGLSAQKRGHFGLHQRLTDTPFAGGVSPSRPDIIRFCLPLHLARGRGTQRQRSAAGRSAWLLHSILVGPVDRKEVAYRFNLVVIGRRSGQF